MHLRYRRISHIATEKKAREKICNNSKRNEAKVYIKEKLTKRKGYAARLPIAPEFIRSWKAFAVQMRAESVTLYYDKR